MPSNEAPSEALSSQKESVLDRMKQSSNETAKLVEEAQRVSPFPP